MAGFELGDIIVTIKAKTDDLKRGVAEVQNITNKAEGGISKLGKLASGMEKFAKVAAVGMAVVGGAAVAFGIMSVKAFSESEDVIKQTEAVIKSTGGVAGVTSEAAQKLASSFQAVTKYSDEAVLGGENLLLTFTNIGQDIFPQATETMLDMSQALGQDVKSSAIQLGKALQDPILGVTALRRVGVNFNEAQTEVIKKLVETGRSAEAQALILKELQTEFGGSAKAAGETFAGKLVILKNKFDDLQESIGGALIKGLTPFIDKIIEWSNGDQGKRTIQDIVDAVANLVAQMTQWITDVAVPWITKYWPEIQQGIRDTWSVLMVFIEIMKYAGIIIYGMCYGIAEFIYTTQTLIQGIIDTIIREFRAMGSFLGGILGGIVGAFRGVYNAVAGVYGAIINAFMGAGSWLYNVGSSIINGLINGIKSAIGGIGRAIGSITSGIGNAVKSTLHNLHIPGFASGTNYAPGGVSVVGEEGPELRYLPGGTKIIPANLTRNLVDNLVTVGDMMKTFLSSGSNSFLPAMAMAGQGGASISKTVNFNGPINIDSQQDADYLMQRIDRSVQLESMGLTPNE